MGRGNSAILRAAIRACVIPPSNGTQSLCLIWFLHSGTTIEKKIGGNLAERGDSTPVQALARTAVKQTRTSLRFLDSPHKS